MPAPSNPTNTIGAGKYSNNMGGWWDGAIDELRVSSVQRSTNWLWAESQTVLANTAFGTYGTVAAPTPIIINGSATGLTVNAAWLGGTLVSTGASATAWGVLWGTNNPGATMSGWLGGGSHDFGGATEAKLAAGGQIQILRLDGTAWRRAGSGTPNLRAWMAGDVAPGTWGVDTATDAVWIVLSQSSIYAVGIVPVQGGVFYVH